MTQKPHHKAIGVRKVFVGKGLLLPFSLHSLTTPLPLCFVHSFLLRLFLLYYIYTSFLHPVPLTQLFNSLLCITSFLLPSFATISPFSAYKFFIHSLLYPYTIHFFPPSAIYFFLSNYTHSSSLSSSGYLSTSFLHSSSSFTYVNNLLRSQSFLRLHSLPFHVFHINLLFTPVYSFVLLTFLT